MRKRHKTVGLATIALVLALALLATACGGGDGDGDGGEKKITIGGLLAFTGPAAASTNTICNAYLDYINKINDEGGIDGVTINAPWAETQLDYAKAIVAHTKMVERGEVLEYNMGSVDAYVDRLVRDKVPVINIQKLAKLSLTDPQWIFLTTAGWGPEFISQAKWVVDTFGGTPRIGVLMVDYDPGWSSVEDAEELLPEVGVEYVGYEVLARAGIISADTELTRLMGKDIDWLFVIHYGGGLTVIMNEIHRMGLREQGINILSTSSTYDQTVVDIIGSDVAEGVYALGDGIPQPHEVADRLGLEDVIESAMVNQGYEVDKIPTSYISGWGYTKVAVEALRRAIEQVGVENVTGRVVRDILSDFEYDTGIFVETKMSDERPFIVGKIRMFQTHDGVIAPISEYFDYYYLLEHE